VTVTSDNRYVIAGSGVSASIEIFDLQTKQLVHHFEKAHQGIEILDLLLIDHLESITSVVVTSDNRYIISGSEDKSIKIFDLGTKQLVHHFETAHKGMEIYIDFQFIFFRLDHLSYCNI